MCVGASGDAQPRCVFLMPIPALTRSAGMGEHKGPVTEVRPPTLPWGTKLKLQCLPSWQEAASPGMPGQPNPAHHVTAPLHLSPPLHA